MSVIIQTLPTQRPFWLSIGQGLAEALMITNRTQTASGMTVAALHWRRGEAEAEPTLTAGALARLTTASAHDALAAIGLYFPSAAAQALPRTSALPPMPLGSLRNHTPLALIVDSPPPQTAAFARFAAAADCIIATSAWVADAVRRASPNANVQTWRPGIDLALWDAAIAQAETTLEQDALPERVRLFVALDADDPALPDVIATFRAQLATECALHLLVPRRTTPHRLAAAYGSAIAAGDISLTTYPVRANAVLLRRAIAAQVATADIVIAPARSAATPWLLMAGMAAGRPVVAADTADLPELLGDAAAYVAPGDSAGLAAAVRALVKDPAYRAAQGEAARARAERTLDAAAALPTLRALCAAPRRPAVALG